MNRVVDELRLIFTGGQRSVGAVRDVIVNLDRRFWNFVLIYLVAGVVFMWLMMMIPRWHHQKCLAESKQRLHAVQLALERWAVDSPGGNYPARLEALAEGGYMVVMPENPFTRRPMEGRVYADYVYAATNPDRLNHGDFGYIPKVNYGETLTATGLSRLGDEDVIGYELVLY